MFHDVTVSRQNRKEVLESGPVEWLGHYVADIEFGLYPFDDSMSFTYCTPAPVVGHDDVLVAGGYEVILAQIIFLHVVTVNVKRISDYYTAAGFA